MKKPNVAVKTKKDRRYSRSTCLYVIMIKFFWSFTAPEVTLFLQTVKLCCQNLPSLSPTKNKIKLGLLYYYIK